MSSETKKSIKPVFEGKSQSQTMADLEDNLIEREKKEAPKSAAPAADLK